MFLSVLGKPFYYLWFSNCYSSLVNNSWPSLCVLISIFVSCFDFLKRTRGRERIKAGGAKPAEIKDEDELEDNQNDTSCQDKSEQDWYLAHFLVMENSNLDGLEFQISFDPIKVRDEFQDEDSRVKLLTLPLWPWPMIPNHFMKMLFKHHY